jgi:hypothetical protein
LRLSSAGLVSTVVHSNPLGAVGTPSYSFTGDLDTGMWSPGADTLALSTAGAERVRIDASGRVGVGGSPAYRLHVIAASSNAVFMAQSSDASGVQAYLQANGSADARVGTLSDVPLLIIQNTAERMRIDTAGNVGIGGVPTTKLDVFNGNIRMTDSYSLVWGDSSTYISGSAATDIITVTTAGAERARFAANGTFTLTGGEQITGTTVAASGVGLELLWDGTQSIVQSYSRSGAAYQVMTFDGSQLRFNSGGAEKMRILASAADQKNVVIGGTVADGAAANRAALQITGGTGGAVLTFRSSAGHQGYLFAPSTGQLQLINLLNNTLEFGTNGAARLVITGAGVIQDAAGNELGYKGLPRATAYAGGPSGLRGKMIAISAGITISATDGWVAGDAFSVYNDSAASITLTQGAATTLRLAGTTTTGSRTLAARGTCTVWANSASEFVLSGAGLT